MGGDIAGKAVVPVIQTGGGFRVPRLGEQRAFTEDELPAVESRVRDMGFYPYRTTQEELEAIGSDHRAIDAIFLRVMEESLERWLALAEERLAGSGVRLYVMTGNDDEPRLRDVLAASPVVTDPEDITVDLGEGFQMVASGWANPTPWNSPREMPEAELEQHLEQLIAPLHDPARAVFNFHVPPIRTPLDRAPVLNASLKPVVKGGAVMMESVGSEAVRRVIERHQPLLALHGHIHESRGATKIGRTVCINPGSEYTEGVLHGALAVLDRRQGLKRYQLTSG